MPTPISKKISIKNTKAFGKFKASQFYSKGEKESKKI
jgi:hypothetical protein